MYHIFLDLDGVMADFDEGVRRITGRSPDQLSPKQLWGSVARAKGGFFDQLPWTSDGPQLWEATRHLKPTVLTGLPMGKWAEPQKRAWCAERLGAEVEVITCLARHKPVRAREWCDRHLAETGERLTPVLVDDRPKYREAWEEAGGIFITHTSALSSIEALRSLGLLEAE